MRTVHGGRKALLITLQLAVLTAFIAFVAARPGGDIARAAETKTWTGLGTDANWSTGANWAPSGAPVAGDSLVFPSGAERQTNNNNLTAGTAFAGIEFTGGSYSITGNALDVTAGVEMTAGAAIIELNIGGAGGVIVTEGSLRLNGTNSYTGTVELEDGRLIAGSNSALGSVGGATQLKGGILELVDGVTSAEPLVTQDATSEVMSNGSVVLSGAISSEATIAWVSESGTLSIQGTISGGAGFIKAGLGTVTFTMANSYNGTTTIEAGTLTLSGAGKLGSSVSGTTVDAGATLLLQNGATIEGEDVTISGNGVAGGGALRVISGTSTADDVTLGANATVFVENLANFEIETGVATTSSAFVLTKSGLGTLIVGDAANVDVSISLTAGILVFDATADTNITMTGGTLRGHGSFKDLIATAGRVLPGNAGEGRIETNTLVAQAAATFSFLVEQAGGGSFWVDDPAASVAIGGAALEILGSGDITPGTTFVLLQGPASSITGTFAGLPDDAVFADAAGRFWRIEYTNAATHTVSIVALVDLEADLSVELSSNATVPQDTANFQLGVKLTNEAATAMPGVKVNVTLPAGVEYVSGPAGCVGPEEDDIPQVVVCRVASLPAGETTLTLVLEVTAPNGSTLIFFAQIDWPGDDPDASNDSDSHSVAVTAPVAFPFRYFLPQVASDGPN